MYEVAIIGGGPAGITAAIYASRAGIKPVVFEKLYMGGQVANTNEIDNYPGFDSISGFDLILKLNSHFEKFDAEVILSEVTKLDLTGDIKIIKTSDNTYEAKTVIITTGAQPARLNVTGEEEFRGRGVSYCATCDGAFYKGKTVAVVGGGNTALYDAIYLSRFCERVYIIHRRNDFRAEKKLVDKMREIPNIELILNSVVEEIKGNGKVESVIVSEKSSTSKMSVNVNGVFIAVGTKPDTGFLQNLTMLNFDLNGAIITNSNMETGIPGVFAAGDARKTPLRQIVTAAADGAVAAYYAAEYLSCLG